MTYEARREYLRKIVVRYRASTWAIKGQILNEFCEVTGATTASTRCGC